MPRRILARCFSCSRLPLDPIRLPPGRPIRVPVALLAVLLLPCVAQRLFAEERTALKELPASATDTQTQPEASSPEGSLIAYGNRGGNGFLALSLQAGRLPKTVVDEEGTRRPSARKHVVVVDTSASQAGAHRRQSLSVLNSFLACLPAGDSVNLMCVDVEVRSLTAGFFPYGSSELQTALAQLKKRVPLGATRLQPAIEAALGALPTDDPGSILYLGDGMSTGKLIEPEALQKLLARLRGRQIAFHSYAVGPRTDLPLLGILAEHTGGVLLADALLRDEARMSKRVGRQLASAAVAPVFYPVRMTLDPPLSDLLPRTIPPLRSDRATVLLATGPIPPTLDVVAEAASGVKLAWHIKTAPEQPGNAFLSPLWQAAQPLDGLNIPLAGTEYLNLARQTFEDQVVELVAFGRQAISARDPRRAEEIAWRIRESDPDNAEARTILNASQRVRLVQQALAGKPYALVRDAAPESTAPEFAVADHEPAKRPARNGNGETQLAAADEGAQDDAPPVPAAEDQVSLAGDAEEPAAIEELPAEPAAESRHLRSDAAGPDESLETAEVEEAAQGRRDLLAEERERMQLRAEALKREVSASIQAAQSISRDDPESSLAELKRSQSTVDAALDIDSGVREQLRVRLLKVINDIAGRKEVLDQIKIRQMERQAQVQAQKNLVGMIVQRDQKLEQLIDRVRSLLTEGYLGNADAFEEGEAVARAAWELAPYSGTTAAAIFDSEAAGQLDKAMRLRSERNDKFLSSLHQVELSHIPFPDEPPILWPPAEVWKALTERRNKWASVDLVRYNPIEERIRKALNSPTDVEFVETPLKDALLFLKDQHNINIWIDETKISDEGVATDQPVTLQLSGVTFRSVLKLLLEPLQLTWVIDDEVMKVTTTVAAGEKLFTRVYPVGDLVIPIRRPMAGGLGQGLGGVGGLGGGGGMMGGGQFGIGGGRGGNGMGGGMF